MTLHITASQTEISLAGLERQAANTWQYWHGREPSTCMLRIIFVSSKPAPIVHHLCRLTWDIQLQADSCDMCNMQTSSPGPHMQMSIFSMACGQGTPMTIQLGCGGGCATRWAMWLQRLRDNLQLHRPYDAHAWRMQCVNFTHSWTSDRVGYPVHPIGNEVNWSQALYEKYERAVRTLEPLDLPVMVS